MSTNNLGMGLCRCGLAVVGFGDVATADDINTQILPDASRQQSQDARFIDPSSKDYVVDQYGRTVGDNSIAQQVYLALITTKGSCANFTLGNDFKKIKTYNSKTIQAQISTQVRLALKTLIDNKSITLINVSVVLSQVQTISIKVEWRNNLTQQNNTFRI